VIHAANAYDELASGRGASRGSAGVMARLREIKPAVRDEVLDVLQREVAPRLKRLDAERRGDRQPRIEGAA
jgi:hypothetical protein